MTSSSVPGFIHRFLPAADPASPLTLLLLHGTGGDESDLIPLGQALAPTASLLSPRGKVLENGMPRFFRRLAEGVFDLDDLKLRTRELAHFLEATTSTYRLEGQQIVAVGFSNGANIAASLLLLWPKRLSGAILFRPMVPLVPEQQPQLLGTPIFVAGGRNDPIVRPKQTEQLVNVLQDAGAAVQLHWEPGGHSIAPAEIEVARAWLSSRIETSRTEC